MKYFTETVERVLGKQIKYIDGMAGEVTSAYCGADTLCIAYRDGRFCLFEIEDWPEGDSNFSLNNSCGEEDVWVLENVGLLTMDELREQSALVKEKRAQEQLSRELEQYQKLKAKFEAGE